MPIARDKNTRKDYTLEREQGREGATVFEIGMTSGSEVDAAHLDLLMSGKPGSAYRYLLLKGGLRGWRNFLDKDGAAVPFTGQPEDLDWLYSEDILELGRVAAKLNSIDGPEGN